MVSSHTSVCVPLTKQIEEDCTAILCVCVSSKVDLLFTELVQQFLHESKDASDDHLTSEQAASLYDCPCKEADY